jgi:nucleotide-binding universal stress UspA family protein
VTYRILCAYDQSAGAEKAFAFALEQATRLQGELHVVSVFEPAEASRGTKSEALAETARRQFATSFEQFQARAVALGVTVSCAVVVGSPATEILKKASELAVDHIVVGQRGKNSHERTTLGSVSMRVMAHSAATTTVAR